jgi:hypothetical protein
MMTPMDALTDLLCRYPGTSWTTKAGAPEMIAVGWALERAGVVTQEKFARMSTTICGRIYFGFDPLVETDPAYVATIAHEFDHVRQWHQGHEVFVVEYLTSDIRRAEYETEAWTVSAEVRHLLGLPIPSATEYAARLATSYGCGPEAVAHCQQILEMRLRPLLDSGAIGTQIGVFIRRRIEARS